MSGETEQNVSGWTIDQLRHHYDTLRLADQRFEAERDRRLSEVAVEREKALKIKESADSAALQLAREIQDYKDEKANQLREQIYSERGLYATHGDLQAESEKIDAHLAPLITYVTTQQGQKEGFSVGTKMLMGAISFATTLIVVGITVLGFVIANH